MAIAFQACRAASVAAEETSAQSARDVRPFSVEFEEEWAGNAVCYGPHRDGQRPGDASPTREELLEDARLILDHWKLVRVYGASEFAEGLLSVIRDERLPMRVVLGVWVAVEERRDSTGVVVEVFDDAVAANQREVEAAVELASRFPEIVRAISVGNETQVFWSAHRSPLDILIAHVRSVRSRVSVPVTVADDFNFWNKRESRELAVEIDFILMHAHPLWNGVQLDDAVDWVEQQVRVVQDMHPNRTVLLGETGWATERHDQGEQARLMKGQVGEPQQRAFYDAIRAWAEKRRIPVFFFEAFDENWKGGAHPNEVEKHWGLFRADRSPKAALARRPTQR